MPLACFDGTAFLAPGRCLGLIRDLGEVATPTSGVRVLGRGRYGCPDSGREVEALVGEGPTPPSFAVWPRRALSRVTPVKAGAPWQPSGCRGWCGFGRTGHPRVKLTPQRRARVVRAVTDAAGDEPGRDLEVLQEVTVDLDGDGADERVYSLAVADRQAEGYAFRFSGLFLERGGTLSLIRRADEDAVVLRGTLDLDGDGLRELWLLHAPTAGQGLTHALITLRTGHPEVIGRYDCRPEEE